MNNHQVAKAWANQTKAHGKGSNFYFEGATIYSYGPHFPIALLTKNNAGATVALMTSRTYSKSTQRHTSLVRMALHFANIPVFFVPEITRYGTYDLAAARGAYLQNARDAFRKAARSRNYKFEHLERAAMLEREAEKLTQNFAVFN
jgi:hypothetical protein